MSDSESVLECLESIASACELTVNRLEGEHLVIAFQMSEERKQTVHLVPGGQIHENTVIVVFSVACELLEGIDPRQAVRLLESNGQHKLGYWGVYEISGRQYLGVGHNLLLTSLAPEMLRAVVFTLAQEADRVEQEMTGEDRF